MTDEKFTKMCFRCVLLVRSSLSTMRTSTEPTTTTAALWHSSSGRSRCTGADGCWCDYRLCWVLEAGQAETKPANGLSGEASPKGHQRCFGGSIGNLVVSQCYFCCCCWIRYENVARRVCNSVNEGLTDSRATWSRVLSGVPVEERVSDWNSRPNSLAS